MYLYPLFCMSTLECEVIVLTQNSRTIENLHIIGVLLILNITQKKIENIENNDQNDLQYCGP